MFPCKQCEKTYSTLKKIPSEILRIIFSYLDKKSRKSATATSKLWFDVIRNDSSLSNHICYNDSAENLQHKIENLEWDWKRWPALKSIEIKNGLSIHYGCNLNRTTHKKDLLNDLSIDFKKCPTLELVIFDVLINCTDVFPNCVDDEGIVLKLAYNPKLDIRQFGVEHIYSLRIWKQYDDTFKLINENVKGLKELEVNKLSFLDDLVGLNGILKLSTQNAIIGHEGIKIEGLKTLKILKVSTLKHLDHLVGMNSLLELHISGGSFRSSPDLKIEGLKKLEVLIIPEMALIDSLVGIDSLLELYVTDVKGIALMEYDLLKIAQRFKNLQKCVICVQCVQSNHPTKEYVEIVENVFQKSATRVKIIFDRRSYSYLTKEPLQRCVLKKLCDACGSEFEARFGPPAVKPIRYVREGIKDFNCIICDKNQDLLSYFKSVHEKNKPINERARICCNEFEYRLSMRDKSL